MTIWRPTSPLWWRAPLAQAGLLPQGGVLYLALDKFCGYSTRTTLKIMGWFVALHPI